MFNGKRYLTRGVESEIPFELQIFMWACIDGMPERKDYLQVFRLSATNNGLQKIIHSQEQPDYKKEYIVRADKPVTEKVYVIDDGDYSTMLLADEY